MTPELHRPLMVERVGPGGLDYVVEANRDECAALANRMNLPSVLSLTCRFRLEQDLAGTLAARGHLIARIVQTCVVSLDDFTATLDERFVVRCVPEGMESDDPDPDALDEIYGRDRRSWRGCRRTARARARPVSPLPRRSAGGHRGRAGTSPVCQPRCAEATALIQCSRPRRLPLRIVLCPQDVGGWY